MADHVGPHPPVGTDWDAFYGVLASVPMSTFFGQHDRNDRLPKV